MFFKKVKIREFEDEQEPQVSKVQKRFYLKELIDGSLLTKDFVLKQLPFILYLTLLAVIYIGNRYHAEKLLRQTLYLQNEIKELRAEAITIASELMYISKQSEVARMVKANGLELEESLEPPKKIVIKSNETLK